MVSLFLFNLGSELQRTMIGHEHGVHLLFPFGHKLLSVDSESLLKVTIRAGVYVLYFNYIQKLYQKGFFKRFL